MTKPRRPSRARLALAAGLGLITALALPAALLPALGAESVDGGPDMPTYVPAPRTALPSGRTVAQGYRTIADVNDEMLALANAHPDLVKMFALPYRTNENRPVYGIEITHHVRAADGKPVFFMMGAIHGNEWPAAEHAIEFAHDLVNLDASDPQVSALLDRGQVTIVPVTNVDGFIHNTRQTCRLAVAGIFLDPSASREPACTAASPATTPVDPNRNYPYGWGGPDISLGSGGAGAGSEFETKNIMAYVTGHQVTVLATNHTSGHTLLYPPLELRAGPTPDDALFAELAGVLTAQNGYRPMRSGEDYETTGETVDWSYYATRALSYTFEITTGGSAGAYQSVVDDYLGIGSFAGHPNRNAFFLAAEYAANPQGHSRIVGTAPAGAVLTVAKNFNLYTAPESGSAAVPTHLSSTLTVGESGSFTWDVNPSLRPDPAYDADGVHVGPHGFLPESWTLTCARPGGEVLQTLQVTVDMGQQAAVDLAECAAGF